MKKVETKNDQNENIFPMRINKYLAHQGYSTRRGADELIEKGKVSVNGKIAVLGQTVEETDIIEVKGGNPLKKRIYLAYNKPEGIVTHSPQGNQVDILKSLGRSLPKGVFPLGRLDKKSRGLIILTNDSRITDRLLNPKYEHEKEYVVKVQNHIRPSFKKHMETGVNIDGYVTKKSKVNILNDRSFSIILSEGKTHQIRRMVSAMHNEVEKLERIRIMNIGLGKLAEGQFRNIEGEELQIFLKSLDINI